MKLTVEEGWSGLGRIALQTVGCKLNQAETESLARKFLEAGYQVVAPDHYADIYLLNTCTVTHIADRKCRNLLRQAHRRNPHALIVATGCYAERAATDIGNIAEIGLLVGNQDKERLVEKIQEKATEHRTTRLYDRYEVDVYQPSPSKGEGMCEDEPPLQAERLSLRTRALVKIQEGCDQPCSFCVVPWVRGRERSLLEEEIMTEVKARVAEGHKEVILTGTKIGRYGKHGGLRRLIQRILKETTVPRLRLSSLDPSDLTTDLLHLWKDSRLCPHIHLPLQSGSDSVLDRMGRAYRIADYQQAVSLAREAIPNLALTTDIMVGFPGESEEEFIESYRFCERIGFAGLHVFPYSTRPGTRAAQIANEVQDSDKKRRCQIMLDLSHRSGRCFREQFLGQKMNVLWEGHRDGIWLGLTDNYLRVFLHSQGQLVNQLLATKLISTHNGGLRGELMTPGELTPKR